MEEFVSEAIIPVEGTFDAAAMGAGSPGLPRGFDWRGETYLIERRLEEWKRSEPEGGRASGERYLRRHYYRLRMRDGAVWVVYFLRQTPRSGSAKRRWFLYSRERGTPEGG
jgi:hypothetical protein